MRKVATALANRVRRVPLHHIHLTVEASTLAVIAVRASLFEAVPSLVLVAVIVLELIQPPRE